MRNIQVTLREAADLGVFQLTGAGGPLSGSSSRADAQPTGFNIAGAGCLYLDVTNQVLYINEGTRTNLYWTPLNFQQVGLLCGYTDFRDGVGKAVADTVATYTIPGSGIRIHGSDVTQTDSGLTIAQGEGGPVASLITTATSGKIAALSGLATDSSTWPFQPDTAGPMVVDALISNSSAITSRLNFIGWLGTAADALAVPFTNSTTVITMVQDDCAGLMVSTGLTATDRWYAPHNKSDEAATIATTATGVDTGITLAAAGTYQRVRVEISAAGVMTCFIDKIQVTQISAAVDTDEELNPVLLIGSLASATKTLLVKRFGFWGARGAA